MLKKTATRTKNFVKRNHVPILITIATVSTTVAVLEQGGIRSLNKFLEEKGLLDEYYFVED